MMNTKNEDKMYRIYILLEILQKQKAYFKSIYGILENILKYIEDI